MHILSSSLWCAVGAGKGLTCRSLDLAWLRESVFSGLNVTLPGDEEPSQPVQGWLSCAGGSFAALGLLCTLWFCVSVCCVAPGQRDGYTGVQWEKTVLSLQHRRDARSASLHIGCGRQSAGCGDQGSLWNLSHSVSSLCGGSVVPSGPCVSCVFLGDSDTCTPCGGLTSRIAAPGSGHWMLCYSPRSGTSTLEVETGGTCSTGSTWRVCGTRSPSMPLEKRCVKTHVLFQCLSAPCP